MIMTAVAKLDDDEALNCIPIHDTWQPGATYEAGTRLQYDGTLYTVLQDHTSQSDWTPEDAPSLFAEVLTSEDGTPLEWVQPDSTNPYMTGDKVTHNGKTWTSDIDNNVWEPGVYGWTETEE
ncbi:MAG: alpha-amylase [Lachnospiraceae bacterium]|nr:alpha-amylase [Lachnospiraceae bacterium]